MVRLSILARCDDEDCAWSAAGPGAQADAERHTRRTGHGTVVVGRPASPDEPYERERIRPDPGV